MHVHFGVVDCWRTNVGPNEERMLNKHLYVILSILKVNTKSLIRAWCFQLDFYFSALSVVPRITIELFRCFMCAAHTHTHTKHFQVNCECSLSKLSAKVIQTLKNRSKIYKVSSRTFVIKVYLILWNECHMKNNLIFHCTNISNICSVDIFICW